MDPFNPSRHGVLAAAMVALVPGSIPATGLAASPGIFSLAFFRSGSGVPASIYAGADRTRLHPNPLLVSDKANVPPVFSIRSRPTVWSREAKTAPSLPIKIHSPQ